MMDPRFDGPLICPRRCTQCDGSEHHWLEGAPDWDNVPAGLEVIWQCKHCPAWMEYDAESEDPQERWVNLHTGDNDRFPAGPPRYAGKLYKP